MAYESIQEAASSCAYDSDAEATPASVQAGAQHNEEVEEVEVGCLHPSILILKAWHGHAGTLVPQA